MNGLEAGGACRRTPLPLGQDDGFDDLELVAEAQNGSLDAFTQLVNRYEGNVFRIGRSILRNQQDAEDVLQETFLKAYEHLSEFQRNSKFSSWLVRIAINQSLMKLRRRDAALVSLDDTFDTGEENLPRQVAAWEPNPEQTYSREQIRKVLEDAIQKLPPTIRAVFVLHDIEGLSQADTAAALGLSVPAAKCRILRSRGLLRAELTRSFKQKPARSSKDKRT